MSLNIQPSIEIEDDIGSRSFCTPKEIRYTLVNDCRDGRIFRSLSLISRSKFYRFIKTIKLIPVFLFYRKKA